MSHDFNAFADYLESVAATPFGWGTFDCLIFTNAATRALTGRGWAEDWAGRYLKNAKPVSRRMLVKTFGFKTLEAAIDARMTRVAGIPPRGALVVRPGTGPLSYLGQAMGICTGTRAAFVADTVGLVHLPIESIAAGWVQP